MDTVFRVATAGDEAAIRRLFVEMLRTIFHTQEVEGYPAGYVGRFFTGGEDERWWAFSPWRATGRGSLPFYTWMTFPSRRPAGARA